MKNNPARRAWFILLGAFSTFCFLTLLIPSSIYWYIITATEPLTTELTSVRGIVIIGDSGDELTTSVLDGNSSPMEEGLTVSTDDTSQAILTFSDDSSLTMYGDTIVTFHQAQTPRFSFDSNSRFLLISNPTKIIIEVKKGRVRATASRDRADLNFDINTPDANVELNQGSFSIEVSEKGTQVITRLGEADVIAKNNASVMLKDGQRAVVGPDIPLSEPLPAAQNLLSESNFRPSFTDSWETYAIVPIEGVTATVDSVIFQNRRVLNLQSDGQDNVHSETGVVQHVNKDVRDFQSLRIFAEVRLVHQSLPGGGQLGSEFPIMLHVAYKDADGNDRDWFHGFYYSPSPDNYILYDHPDNSSERIARFIWYPYESVNLLTTLGPAKPAFIKSIRIYASGWIYDAMVANISLLAEE